jgi:hypothetical protein
MINIKILIGFQSLLLSLFGFFCIFINRSKTDSSFFCFYSLLQLIFINIKGCRVDKTVGIYKHTSNKGEIYSTLKSVGYFRLDHLHVTKILHVHTSLRILYSSLSSHNITIISFLFFVDRNTEKPSL